MNSSEELTHFKTNINLIDYAASQGYSIDQRKSSSSNVVMRDAHGDAICITLYRKTHEWVYWSFGDDADKGTIIDFIQKRRGLTLGEVRKELRNLYGDIQTTYVHPVVQSSPDLEVVRAAYDEMQFIQEHPYLVNERCIPVSTLNHPKFIHRIKIDSRTNAIFPHFDSGQVCGYEIKNSRFTGFSPHGKRGLWCSVWDNSNHSLIITESAIDAFSFHALYDQEHYFYVSLGGQLGKRQITLIQRLVKYQKPQGIKTVIVATDNDEAGEKYHQQINECLQDFVNYGGVLTRIKSPLKDWNAWLQSQEQMDKEFAYMCT